MTLCDNMQFVTLFNVLFYAYCILHSMKPKWVQNNISLKDYVCCDGHTALFIPASELTQTCFIKPIKLYTNWQGRGEFSNIHIYRGVVLWICFIVVSQRDW